MGGESRENLPTIQFPVLPLTKNAAAVDESPEPPLQTLAAVPFKWEEQPGKPRSCTDIIVRPPTPEPVRLVLELPPCRKYGAAVLDDGIAKTPSPTAVLDGPYSVGRRPKFSSFRLFLSESVNDDDEDGITTPPTLSANTMEGFVGERRRKKKKKRGGLFGKFSGGGGKKEARGGEGRFGFSSSSRFSPFSTATTCENDQQESTETAAFAGKMRRNGSSSDGLLSSDGVSINGGKASSHFLASIYEGLKQAIHWNSSSRRSSKETHI